MSAMPELPDGETLTTEARRVLPRLCESGALLAVSKGMNKAIVLRGEVRTAVVDTSVAQALALKNWITCEAPGAISRYRITAEGRSALGRLVAEVENQARGFAEAQAGFDGPPARVDQTPSRAQRMRAESPLQALARRREKDGTPFLSAEMVMAGERLREDFELAQLGPNVTQDWDRFQIGRVQTGGGGGLPGGRGGAARARFDAALQELGPGLADVALYCCCHLEGLEVTEKRMGWSQRSGKIVLRIALQRLMLHYEAQGGASDLIG